MSIPVFKGFPAQCVEFYQELSQNNRKAWFDEHREHFEKHVMEPARIFVYEMGNALKKISPGIIADSRINRSIFRPYRDTRFAHDKTPYKTHLGIFFWEGKLAKMDCPGFYFHLEQPILMLGVGNHCFSKDILHFYRESVADPKHGKALRKAIEAVSSQGNYEIGIKKYKQVPRGYEKNHPNAELLLFAGLTASCEMPVPPELYTEDLVEWCFRKFVDMKPIHEWLVEMNERMIRKPKTL